MFTKAKSLRVVLLIVLAASVLTAGSTLASAVPQDYFYDCNTGIRSDGANTYFIMGGTVILGSSCIGDVLLPNGVISIGDEAFKNARSLTSITIPSTVESIENSAFESSTLATITFQGSSELISIGERAFSGATSLTSITIPNSVTSIGYSAFYSATSLTSLTIGNSVTSIVGYAFANARSLMSITIPNSVTSIGINAFGGARSLTFLTIGNSVTSIGDYAFSGATSLTSITIPNSVKSIGYAAFGDATSLTSVTIPNSVTSIGGKAFVRATSLTSITIPNSITSIEYATFAETTSLTSITIPNSVTSIGSTAFYLATALTSITIPNSVTSIGDYAFSEARSLNSITIPSSVISIGANAFNNTTSLTHYTYCGTSLNQTALNAAQLGSPKVRNSCTQTGLSSSFSSASSYDGRFTVQVTNYDEAFTYAVSSSAGQVSINSTGLITVTGLRPDQSVTVTMTTSRSGYDTTTSSVTGRSQVAAMTPSNKPTVTVSDTLITCTIGSYSAAPTSAAFSLFVDGKHISTNFSATGDYLPDWIIPWASSSTITRTATLTSATWATSDAFKGKEITCATLAYSKNAIGFTASQAIVAP